MEKLWWHQVLGPFWGRWLEFRCYPRNFESQVFQNRSRSIKILWIVPFEVTRHVLFEKMNRAFLEQAARWNIPIHLDLITPPWPKDGLKQAPHEHLLVMEPLVVNDPRAISMIHCYRLEKDVTLKKQAWLTLLEVLKKYYTKKSSVS